MKKIALLFLLATVAAASANAEDFTSQRWSVGANSFNFAAPVLPSLTGLPGDIPAGSIAYDNSSSGFYGLNTSGTWIPLSGSSSSSSAPRCQLTYDGNNGFGTTNTAVRRFVNQRVSTGTCGTWTDSATDGGSFTVATAGIYSINWHDSSTNATGILGIMVNGTNGAGNARLTTYAQGLRALSATAGGLLSGQVSWTGFLNVGDVVTFQSSVSGLDNTSLGAQAMFTITQVSN